MSMNALKRKKAVIYIKYATSIKKHAERICEKQSSKQGCISVQLIIY